MEQHPIPQQISSYQFRLVGDMTLKQFFQVAGGALVSLLIYSTNIYPIIKWPLIILSFAIGAALAFLPFEERPLSRWIWAFFKSIYSPTIFIWQKSQEDYAFFQEEAAAPKDTGVIAPHGEVVLENYLKNLPDQSLNYLASLEGYEQSFLSKIKDIFASAVSPVKTPLPTFETPQKPVQIPTPITVKKPAPPSGTPLSVASMGFRPKIVIEEKQMEEKAEEKKELTTTVKPILTGEKVASQQAQFSLQAAPPNPPTIPNTVVGQVMDPSGKIVEGAILEIRDLAGRPVRALRSNKVGHFMIVTALTDGTYEIITEKEGLLFDPVTFEAGGEIVPPIAIKARAVTQIQQEIINGGSQNIATV